MIVYTKNNTCINQTAQSTNGRIGGGDRDGDEEDRDSSFCGFLGFWKSDIQREKREREIDSDPIG